MGTSRALDLLTDEAAIDVVAGYARAPRDTIQKAHRKQAQFSWARQVFMRWLLGLQTTIHSME